MHDILAEHHPTTVRSDFYQMVSRGLADKTETEYKMTVSRLLTEMRRSGRIPYGWLVDGTRRVSRLRAYDSMADAVEDTARFYRRRFWSSQPRYVEVWSEKDAITGAIEPVTLDYDVPLMVTRGFSSLTFLHAAGETIAHIGKPTTILHLGDHDPSDVKIATKTEQELKRFAPLVPITFRRLLHRPEPVVLVLSPEAGRLLNNWFSFIEPRLRPDTGDLRHCMDWANKAQGHVVRLAAVLHMAELGTRRRPFEPLEEPISFNTMYAACRLWEYSAEHAIRLFSEMGARPETQVAKKVLRWIERSRAKAFSQRDAFQAVKGGIVETVDGLAAGLRVLEQHGYLLQEPAPARSGPGKLPGPHFTVHPNIGGIGGTGGTSTPGAEGTEGLVLSKNNTTYNSTKIPPTYCPWPHPGHPPNTPNIPPERVFCVICWTYAAPARQLPEDKSWVGSCCAMGYVETPDGPVPVDEHGRCLICGACDPLVGLDEVCRRTLDRLALLAGGAEELCATSALCSICHKRLLLHHWWKHADCIRIPVSNSNTSYL